MYNYGHEELSWPSGLSDSEDRKSEYGKSGHLSIFTLLTLKRLGGLKGPSPPPPPLDISRDYSATRKGLAATLYDFFLSSFPLILTPNL